MKSHVPALSNYNPWLVSGLVHALLGGAVLILIFWRFHQGPGVSPDIEIIETPKMAPQAITIAKPAVQPVVKSRQVYGVTRKSVTGETGLAVKQGNTLAKTPDTEKLKDTDAESLPIPTEEYLVSEMPKLQQEVFVPYPPEAKARGVQGVVTMDLLIDSSGSVRRADLVEGPDPVLNNAALKAAYGFKFSPAKVGEKPVAVKIRYSYRFVIQG